MPERETVASVQGNPKRKREEHSSPSPGSVGSMGKKDTRNVYSRKNSTKKEKFNFSSVGDREENLEVTGTVSSEENKQCAGGSRSSKVDYGSEAAKDHTEVGALQKRHNARQSEQEQGTPVLVSESIELNSETKKLEGALNSDILMPLANKEVDVVATMDTDSVDHLATEPMDAPSLQVKDTNSEQASTLNHKESNNALAVSFSDSSLQPRVNSSSAESESQSTLTTIPSDNNLSPLFCENEDILAERACINSMKSSEVAESKLGSCGVKVTYTKRNKMDNQKGQHVLFASSKSNQEEVSSISSQATSSNSSLQCTHSHRNEYQQKEVASSLIIHVPEIGISSDKTDGQYEKLESVSLSPKGSVIRSGRRKLLVLDLNGLLADINQYYAYAHKAHKNVSGKFVFKRPFCDDFLKFCFQNFEIGIWSSRKKYNVDSVVDCLFGNMKQNLLFCWDQSKCTITGFSTIENVQKPLVLKELKKLWNKDEPDLPWEKGDYSATNTLLVDDSPYKALRNPPYTAIFPYPYCFKDQNDNSLGPGGDLRLYLEGLAMTDDVQGYVREHPFGQPAITDTDPSWNFYLQIIDKVEKSTVLT